jgi:hypothetical protein
MKLALDRAAAAALMASTPISGAIGLAFTYGIGSLFGTALG